MDSKEDAISSSEDSVDDGPKREKRESIRPPESLILAAKPSCSGLQPDKFDCSFREGLPFSHYGFRMQLYCRTGFHLVIRENGKVEGVDEDMHEDAIVEFNSVDHYGLLRIRGVKSNLYLAMNKKGRLYGEPNPEKPSTVFIESDFNSYFTYLSHEHKEFGWYVGIKKSGKAKPGPRTKQEALIGVAIKASEDGDYPKRVKQDKADKGVAIKTSEDGDYPKRVKQDKADKRVAIKASEDGDYPKRAKQDKADKGVAIKASEDGDYPKRVKQDKADKAKRGGFARRQNM